MTQLLAIFRAPLDKDNFDQDVFVELEFDENSVADSGRCFTTGNVDSSYRLMGFDHIVFAERIEGGSCDIIRMQLRDPNEQPAVIHELDHTELETIVLHMWNEYETGCLDDAAELLQ